MTSVAQALYLAAEARTLLRTDGGWYAILEVPRTRDEDAWVETLVRDHGIVVHPGYFFDMEREGFLVVSLLPHPDVFAAPSISPSSPRTTP